MALETLSTARASESGADNGGNEPWHIIGVPATSSQWHHLREPSPDFYMTGYDCGDTFELAVSSSYLRSLENQHAPFTHDYNPIQPTEQEEAVRGKLNAAYKARTRWLQHTAAVISGEPSPSIGQALRNLARRRGLYEELDRQILINDIEVNQTPNCLTF